ncbi:hypothetical protein [Anaerovibrio sp. RM50]|uniref:hypothetical protein n=1 Tax=Anaerovibrio sp. RM50 TaxID=1200557 RepID=UPI0012EBFD86|nr:hypothetical protein [Anaerovibrio sp. RM50]
MVDKLLKFLDEEVERHKDQENREARPWDRGFEVGAMTEAIQLRIKVRELMKG